MILKSWDPQSKYYDSIFDVASTKAWQTFINENIDFNPDAWEKRFHCKVISNTSDRDTWIGLEFNDESHYIMFLLEWS
jgi:hypothetical protein